MKTIQLNKIIKYCTFTVFLLVMSLNSFAQLSDLHYLPPLRQFSDGVGFTSQKIYLSTPVTTAFTVDVYLGSSTTPFTTLTVSKASSAVYTLANGGDNDITLLTAAKTGIVQSASGLRFQSSGGQKFYVNWRGKSNAQASSLTSKGRAALGTSFKWGGVPNLGLDFGAGYNAALGIMATEDGTTVEIFGYNPNSTFRLGANAAGITADALTITLNAGQTYVLEAPFNASSANRDGWLGASITSTKNIAVNIGEMLFQTNPTSGIGQDAGMDQIIPENTLGKEYVFVRGNGVDALETPVIIATRNDTKIYVNGAVTPIATLNNGEYYVIPGTNYSSSSTTNSVPGANMYVFTSHEAYAFQALAGSAAQNTGDINFIAPVNCLLSSAVDYIPTITNMAGMTINGGVTIVASTAIADADIIVKHQGGQVSTATLIAAKTALAGNPNWKTYYISGLTGDVSVAANGPIAVGFFGFSGFAGSSGYFSGFETIPTLNVTVVGDGCLPSSILTATPGFTSYAWYNNGVLITGETGNTYTPSAAGNFTVVVSNGSCTYESAGQNVYDCNPELVLEVTTDNTIIASASTVVFTVKAKYLDYNNVSNLVITNVLPTNVVTYVSASASYGTWNAADKTWSIGTMYPGEEHILTVTCTVKTVAAPTNGTYTISSTQNFIGTETNTVPDHLTETITAVALLIDPNLSDFSIPTKTVIAGDFTITPPVTLSTGLISYTSSNPNVATVSGSIISVISRGTTLITASQAADNNYFSSSISSLLTVTSAPFATTWQTDASTNVTIPLTGSGYDFSINWGDGTIETKTGSPGNITHTYATAGVKTVSITPNITTGFPRIYVNNFGNRNLLKTVESWGDGIWGTSVEKSFYNAANLEINATDTPNFSQTTNFKQMFSNCSSLTGNNGFSNWTLNTNAGASISFESMFYRATAFNGTISNWDVSKVTNMSSMFVVASSFNQDLSNWDVSSVTNMSYMFHSSPFNSPLNWGVNTGNVTSMVGMFHSNGSFNQDISGWDVSSVTNMYQMFYRAGFNSDLNSWDVSSLTNAGYMFQENSVFNGTVSNWQFTTDASKNISMTNMFKSARAFNQNISGWDVTRVTNMSNMFNGASVFNTPLNWGVKTGNVTNMVGMFGNTVFNQDISGWDVSKVTNMSSMFYRATTFNGTISNWDVSKVTNMSSMFVVASSFNQDLSNWDVSSVTDMSYMFHSSPFNSPLNWGVNTGNVTSMAGMFHSNGSFNQDISGWDVSSVTNMYQMFYRAGFNSDLNSWDVSSLTNAGYMFQENSVFNGTVSNWQFTTDASKNISMANMFKSASAFNQNISGWDVTRVTNMSNMFNGVSLFNQDISSWNISNVTNLTNFLYGGQLSSANYNALLLGWSTLDAGETLIPLNLNAHFGSSIYTNASGVVTARNTELIGTKNWTITDGGLYPTFTNFNNYVKTYFDGSFTITDPTSTSTGAFTYTSDNAAIATISGNTVTITGAGTANITATQAADATYSSGSSAVSLTVSSVSVVDKYGRVSTTSVYYVNKNGSIGGNDAIDLNGKKVLTKAPAVGDFRDGGIVFWVDGSGGGLVVSAVNQSTSAEWGCYGTAITGASGTAIGTGAQNTVDIEADCSTVGTAADICANLTLNGYTDWFLPSKLELLEIYNNRVSINATSANNAGTSLGTAIYWSSTEYTSSRAFYCNFNGPVTSTKAKINDPLSVRAVRAF